jgi:hypothetical protein
MSVSHRGRRLLALAGAVTLAATLAVQASASAREVQFPTGAGRVYGWGPATWRDEYETFQPASRFLLSSRADVERRFGMLVLKGRADGRSVAAKLADRAYRYGRWETRISPRQWADRTEPFRMIAELVPAYAPYRCGTRNIVLADYTMGENRAHLAIRNGRREFTYAVRPNLGPGDWNTYAVEITRHHISWFVDDHVVMTERRAAARTGLAYTLRYRVVGPRTNIQPPWMRMDWSRYHTLRRPNQLSIAAPRALEKPLHRTCA